MALLFETRANLIAAAAGVLGADVCLTRFVPKHCLHDDVVALELTALMKHNAALVVPAQKCYNLSIRQERGAVRGQQQRLLARLWNRQFLVEGREDLAFD